jgi:hypothetical protein
MCHSCRRVFPVLLAAAIAAVLPLAAHAAATRSADVKVVNRTDWEIHELYLSSSDDENWGPDQLGEEVIGKGESFTLLAIPCDDYDVKIVDEEGDACIVAAVDICGESQEWAITSGDLLKCQAGTAAEGSER